MNKDVALKNLADLAKILDAHDIEYWIDSGTLLGAVREKDFIAHDTDTDIAIKAEDCADIPELISLFGSLLAGGFRIFHTFGRLNMGYEISLWRDGVKTDIFWAYEKGDKRWFALWKNAGKNGDSDLIKLVFDSKYFKNLGTIEFKGIEFSAPLGIEEYLVERYGKDWKTPKPEWNWATSPVCINNEFQI